MKNNIRKGLETLLGGNQGGKTRNTGNTPRTANTNGAWDERQSGMYDPAKILNDAVNRALGLGNTQSGEGFQPAIHSTEIANRVFGLDNTAYDLPDWQKQIHADYESGRAAQKSPAATLGAKIIETAAATPKIRPDGWRPDGFRQLTEALKQGWQPDEAPATRTTGLSIAPASNYSLQDSPIDYKPGDVTSMRRLIQRLQTSDAATAGQTPAFNSLRDLAENMKQRASKAVAASYGIEEPTSAAAGRPEILRATRNGNTPAGITQNPSKRNNPLGAQVSKLTTDADMRLYGGQSRQDGDSNAPDGIINVSTGSASKKNSKPASPVVDDNWKPDTISDLKCATRLGDYLWDKKCEEYRKKKLGWLFKNNYAEFQEESAREDSRYDDLQKVVRKAHEYSNDHKAPLKNAVQSAIAYFPKTFIKSVYNYANSPLSAPNISMMEQDYLAWEQNDGARPGENRHMYDQFTGFPWEKFQNSEYANNHKLPLKNQIKQWISENPRYWKTVELKSLGWKKEDLDAYNEFVDLASGIALKGVGM